jgi:hypothetical protein
MTQSAFDLGLAVTRRLRSLPESEAAERIGRLVERDCAACASGEPADKHSDGGWYHEHTRCGAGVFRELEQAP